MKAIILAGGLGTRLRSVVSDVPKPMAPVAGRPFLEILIASLIRKGIDDIILSVGYQREKIIDYFGSAYKGVPVNYAVEEAPLGTGGALLNAFKKIDLDEDVFILNGDTFLDLDLPDMKQKYEASRADVGIALKKMEDCSRYGRVVLSEEKRVIGFAEKGEKIKGVINAGVYILRPSFLGQFGFEDRFSLESDCFVRHADKIVFCPYIVDSYFIDIGVPEDYERAQTELISTFQ